MITTVYKSDALIKRIEEETGSKFNAEQRSAVQKEIRKFFVNIHREAVDATIMANNKKTFQYPPFYD